MAINTPTTFIIGAGASEPFGVPLAASLATRAKKLEPKDDLTQLLYHLYGIERVNGWLHDFSTNEPVRSIDKFLQDREHVDGFNEVGRAVLAGLMARSLQPSLLKLKQGDWVDEIVSAMSEGCGRLAEFEKKNTGVQVVSFNFENLAQERVRDNLKMRYRDEAAAEKVAPLTFPVHHVHGRLPSPLASGILMSGFEQLKASWVSWVPQAAKAIRSVHDADVDQDVLAAARAAIREAKVVMWLGLHYHAENLERLAVNGTHTGHRSQYVFGSAYELKPGRREWVRERIAGIQLGAKEAKCLNVLEDFNWRR